MSLVSMSSLAGSLLFLQPTLAAEIADQIWSGGPILTINDAQPRVEAVAVKDGKILALGSSLEMQQHQGDKTLMQDLKGSTLLPGFFDAHGHAFMIGLQASAANLLSAPDGEVKDIKSLQDTLRKWSADHAQIQEKIGMMIGFGYDDAQLAEERHPTRHDLDEVSTEIPILIIHQSSHLGVMNTKALELLGITAESPDPAGGVIRRHADSQVPNGVLEESAFFMHIAKHFGRIDEAQAKALLESGANLLASYGYTTGEEGRSTVGLATLMQKIADTSELPIDIVTYVDTADDRDFIVTNTRTDYKNGFRVAGAKMTIDGSPQGFTAHRDRPYYNPPEGYRADYHGYPAISSDEAFETLDWAFKNNVQVITHANGEAAVDLLSAAVKTAKANYPDKELRPVLIHGQFLRKDQVATLDELEIFPSLFPMHTFYWGDWHRDRTVGPVNADNISPTGWVRERGMMFSSHHDAPVAFPNSMRVLSSTVTRRTRSGDILGPDQRVDVMTALKAMTIWPAYQHFEEKEKGSLEPGKLADFVVLSADPTAVKPEMLDQIEVQKTVKNGKVIYTAK